MSSSADSILISKETLSRLVSASMQLRSRLRRQAAALLAVWAVSHMTGCSLVFFTTGAIADHAKPDECIYGPAGLGSISAGETVDVFRSDGTTVSGEFGGLETPPDTAYPERYQEFLRSSPFGDLLPAVGDSIVVVTQGALGRGVQSGTFLGFSPIALRLESMRYGKPIGILLRYIDTVSCPRGRVIAGDTLRQRFAGQEVPYSTLTANALITGKDGVTIVPVERIREVRVHVSNNRKWWGLGVGAVLDGLMIWSLSNMTLGGFL